MLKVVVEQSVNLWSSMLQYMGAAPAEARREERELVGRITEAMEGVPGPAQPVLSISSALEKEQPVFDPERRIPLTW